MKLRRHPTGIVERARLDESDSAVRRSVTENVRSTFPTELSKECLPARAAAILICAQVSAFDDKAVQGDCNIEGKSRSRILLTGFAVTDDLHRRLGIGVVANRTTQASSRNLGHSYLLTNENIYLSNQEIGSSAVFSSDGLF
jgi:hypothetical protein